MAAIILDPIKYLERLPEFSGVKRDLYTFVSLIDRIHPVLRQYDELSQLVFSDLIKSRLRGKARETVEINFQAQSWTDVKTILMNNFGEKYGIEELYDRMRSVTFKTNTVDFYNEIRDKLRSLNNKTCMIMGGDPGAGELARNNMRSALNIFKEKIPEPMRTILACRDPGSLEEAMEILFKSGYAYYTNKIVKPNTTNNRTKPDSNNTNGQRSANYQFPRQYPTQQQNSRPYNNQYNQQNARTSNNTQPPYQQNAQTNRGNYNQQPAPEPMDVNLVRNSDELYTPHNEPFEQDFNEVSTDQEELEETEPFTFDNVDGDGPQNFPLTASQENYRI